MKERFQDISFTEQEGALIKVCNRIIDGYARQGYDLSLRQLYYVLVTKNIIPNVPRSYEKLGALINEARMAGLVDWDMIVDRGRHAIVTRKFSGPGKAVSQLVKTFKLNRWIHQPFYIEVMAEKQALEGVLSPVCSYWGITYSSNKGYSSASALYAAAKRLAKKAEAGKQVVVLYLGDHDPSGIDMTRDIRDRLTMFSRLPIDVKRLALNMSQVQKLNLPPNPAKMSDSRAPDYCAKFGNSSWELDAIPPRILSEIISRAVMRRLDDDAWKKDEKREKKAIEILKNAVHSIDREFSGPAKQEVVVDDDSTPPPKVEMPKLTRESGDDVDEGDSTQPTT